MFGLHTRFGIFVGVTALAAVTIRVTLRFCLRDLIPCNARVDMSRLIRIIDSDGLDTDLCVQQSAGFASGARTRYIAAVVSRACRAKFGFNASTEANDKTARKWMYDLIVAMPDMRKSDVSRILNFALVLVYIPDSTEVRCQQMKVATPRLDRDRAYAAKWWDWWYFRPSYPLSG
jgi:hypothetical protein